MIIRIWIRTLFWNFGPKSTSRVFSARYVGPMAYAQDRMPLQILMVTSHLCLCSSRLLGIIVPQHMEEHKFLITGIWKYLYHDSYEILNWLLKYQWILRFPRKPVRKWLGDCTSVSAEFMTWHSSSGRRANGSLTEKFVQVKAGPNRYGYWNNKKCFFPGLC